MNKKITIIGILIVLLAVFAAGCVHQPVAPPVPPVEQPVPPVEQPVPPVEQPVPPVEQPVPPVEQPVPPVVPQKIVVSGSTSVAPIATDLANAFMDKYPHITIEVHSLGSTAGIVGVRDGVADIGMTSRDLTGTERGWGLNEVIICYDPIVVIAHRENPVTDISLKDLRGIFIGEIINWNTVGGPNRRITVVIREDGSGTRTAFEDSVHRNRIPVPTVISPGTGAVRARVAGDITSIGYISMGAVTGAISPLRVNGVEATPATVLDGSYPIVRSFIMLTKGAPDPVEQTFLDFILSPDGQEIIRKGRFVPIK